MVSDNNGYNNDSGIVTAIYLKGITSCWISSVPTVAPMVSFQLLVQVRHKESWEGSPLQWVVIYKYRQHTR